MIQKLKTSILISLSFLIISCSEYRKVLKTEGYEKKLKAATEYYENEEYFKASTLFNDIRPLVKGSEESEIVDFYFANTLYKLKQFDKSAKYFKGFIELFSRSEKVIEAEYLYAISLYKTSPNSNLDQSSTVDAISAVQNFINKYPYSEYSMEANNIIDELQVKLETKNFENAKQYYKTRNYKSAIIAIKNFENDFPDSSFNEEGGYLKILSQYLISINSFENLQEERFKVTIDFYLDFIDKYPKSSFQSEAEKMYVESLNLLTKFAEQKK
ncbi:MAG: outer membrane protein assembly factor BamD [Cytophagia bacterium]|jgi:outer membrane protein assembly factor BamD|nr:outer membrane protein assembly factor BamD [Cytophagia bacterium]|tara:strand:- start:302 stop:1114 length:813 start_codon:yes stop_codon:yes gene_type:complete